MTHMPFAAPKPCTQCGVLVSDGTARCAVHKPLGKFADRARGTRQQRGYGADHERARKRELSRDKGLCQPCLRLGRYRPGRICDHIVPRAFGGSDEDSNRQTICDDCHATKTAAEGVAAAGGRVKV